MKQFAATMLLALFANMAAAKHGSDALYGKKWIGPGGEYLEFRNDSAFYATAFYYPGKYTFRLRKKKLDLIAAQGNEPSFTILRLTGDTLEIQAANSRASELLETKGTVTFISLNLFNDPSFHLEKIGFSRSGSGMAVGDYVNLQFEIDSSGAMLASCVPGKGKYNGTYKGQLSPAQLEQFIELANTSGIAHFIIPHKSFEDVPGYGFKFYYNGKLKEAYGQGIPYQARPLADYISSLIYTVALEKVSDKFGLKW